MKMEKKVITNKQRTCGYRAYSQAVEANGMLFMVDAAD